MKNILLAIGFIILIGCEIARVYLIMPFPGSQVNETIALAYWLENHIWWFRIVGLLLVAYPSFVYLQHRGVSRWVTAGLLLVWLVVAYLFNFKFLADHMFYQPSKVVTKGLSGNRVPMDQLVLGVNLHGEAKCYPLEFIGYHHQVRDTIGGLPVMVTYCTVCRTGRVYRPEVNAKPERFRLVGMDHFNAMFEDASTRSWWRQANGEAIAGPLKGTYLPEVPSSQMTLEAWLRDHPASGILQPDSTYAEHYENLKGYGDGTIESALVGRDSSSWNQKSWVVGVQIDGASRAYDWNQLVFEKTINDRLADHPLLVALEPDSATFHSWSRVVGLDTLTFIRNDSLGVLQDQQTRSLWRWNGESFSGLMEGKSLEPLQAYQEFWHSWKTFHKETSQYSH